MPPGLASDYTGGVVKFRRHHNNNGLRRIKSGSNERELRRIAKRLGLNYGPSAIATDVPKTPAEEAQERRGRPDGHR